MKNFQRWLGLPLRAIFAIVISPFLAIAWFVVFCFCDVCQIEWTTEDFFEVYKWAWFGANRI